MTAQYSFFQALLRPAVLQILRATGFHSARPAAVDFFTDLAARYLLMLCHATAAHAAANGSCHAFTAHIQAEAPHAGFHALAGAPLPPLADDAPAPSIVDVRMALEDVSALAADRPVHLLPLVIPASNHGQDPMPPSLGLGRGHDACAGALDDAEDDLGDVHDFIAWFSGPRMREIQALALVDGETEAMDYLNSLKKKHSKTGEESKYHSTILGRGIDQGEVRVEGGTHPSIQAWMDCLLGAPAFGDDDPASRGSPGLDPTGDVEMTV